MKKNTERIAILSRTVYEAEALSGLFFFAQMIQVLVEKYYLNFQK